MPLLAPLMTVVITPLLALYLKFKAAQFVIRIALFGIIYALFKDGMQYVIDTIMSKLNGINFPCMAAYVINGLDIFSMLNFALSLWATIYLGRFLLNFLTKLV